MSGLAVLFHRDGRPVEPHSVTAMLAAAPYRGPDGMRAHLFDDVAMGQLELEAVAVELERRLDLLDGHLYVVDAAEHPPQSIAARPRSCP